MLQTKIYFVEDEEKIRRSVRDFLTLKGYSVETEGNGKTAYEYLMEHVEEYDLLILDIMLPFFDGKAILKGIREISDIPVIMLTAKTGMGDQLASFDMGADDYLTKPFMLAVLEAHIQAVLRRSQKEKGSLELGKLRIDEKEQRVYVSDRPVELTRREFDVLLYLIRHSREVLSRNQILDAVWGYDFEGGIRSVDTVIKRLRAQLTHECNYIHTVYGAGYRFQVPDEDLQGSS
ncbi:MAG: response regulator transcription factor [Lachnospiraceae bacterium]|nr:response regulator transcription factor [Lachnospiraceae bacterium]